MKEETNGEAYTCISSCYKCNRRIVVEFYEDSFATEKDVIFLGRLGTRTYSYCPYCGIKESGFSPYDWDQKMDLSLENDPEDMDEEEGDRGESWWPDADGVTLFDEEEEDEEDDSWDESEKVAFTCSSCGKKTRLNPKGCDKIFCYYCGEEAFQYPEEDE